MKFIHLGCLREWFENKKLYKETDYYVSIAWENLACELCQTAYPDMLKVVDQPKSDKSNSEKSEKDLTVRTIDIISIPLPDPGIPYVILNCLNVNTLRKENSKIIYIIYFVQNKISMGRGHEANVRIADISISRKHAVFSMEKTGELWVRDDGSKFGTMVLQ